MPKTVLISLALLVPCVIAGIQVPIILVINISPFDAQVDFTTGKKCLYHDFDPSYLNAYFDSWKSADLASDFGHDFNSYNGYLQQFKAKFGVPDLKSRTAAMGRIQTIDGMDWKTATVENVAPAPYSVFIAEVDAGLFSGCKDQASWQSFAITVNGSTETSTLIDPTSSQWHLNKTGPDLAPLVIGSGGSVDWLTVTLDALAIAGAIATFGWRLAALSMEGAIIVDAEGIAAMSEAEFAYFGALRLAYTGAIKTAYTIGGGTTLAQMLDALVLLTKDDSNPATVEDKQALKRQADAYSLGYTEIYDGVSSDHLQACVMGNNW